MRKIAAIILLILLSACSEKQFCINSECITLEIADTPEERAQGLMYREELAENTGMLFIYEKEGIYSFWMKNTLIPLDIIWISKDLEVVHLDHMVPCTEEICRSYRPDAKAMYVLETNYGFIEKNNVKLSDRVIIK